MNALAVPVKSVKYICKVIVLLGTWGVGGFASNRCIESCPGKILTSAVIPTWRRTSGRDFSRRRHHSLAWYKNGGPHFDKTLSDANDSVSAIRYGAQRTMHAGARRQQTENRVFH